MVLELLQTALALLEQPTSVKVLKQFQFWLERLVAKVLARCFCSSLKATAPFTAYSSAFLVVLVS